MSSGEDHKCPAWPQGRPDQGPEQDHNTARMRPQLASERGCAASRQQRKAGAGCRWGPGIKAGRGCPGRGTRVGEARFSPRQSCGWDVTLALGHSDCRTLEACKWDCGDFWEYRQSVSPRIIAPPFKAYLKILFASS